MNETGKEANICAESVRRGPRVYFIRQGDAIKIGFSENVQQRLAGMQTSHHEPLVLLGSIRANFETERELHFKFRHLQIRGEWFRAEPELLEFIANPTVEELPTRVEVAQPEPAPRPVQAAPLIIERQKFPLTAERFRDWANEACRTWPGDLQAKAYRAWQAMIGHSSYPRSLIDEFDEAFAVHVAKKRAAAV